jgi:hypothetical protein
MPVFLIDPTTQTTIDVEERFVEMVRERHDRGDHPGDALVGAIKATIGDPKQVIMRPIAGGRLVLAVDNFGMLKQQQRFWRLSDGNIRIAGTALLLAVGPEGTLMPLSDEARPTVEAAVVWEPEGLSVVKIVERLSVSPGEPPQIVPIPVFSDDPDPAWLKLEPEPIDEPDPDLPDFLPQNAGNRPGASQAPAREDGAPLEGWSVRSRPDGSARAVRYVLDGDSLSPAEMLTAGSLDALRLMRPDGLRAITPSDDDAEDVIELWVRADA